jgi:hypothetical protein
MPTMKLRDSIVTLLNPCPDVSERELGERMKLLVPAPDVPAFAIEVKWSSGSEAEEVALAPGESIELAEPVAADLEKAFRHRGLVIVERHEDETSARRHGLLKAIEFFRSRGTESILEVQGQRGWTDEHVLNLRNSGLRSQHLNKAREEVLQEELERIAAGEAPSVATKHAKNRSKNGRRRAA